MAILRKMEIGRNGALTPLDFSLLMRSPTVENSILFSSRGKCVCVRLIILLLILIKTFEASFSFFFLAFVNILQIIFLFSLNPVLFRSSALIRRRV